MPATLRNQITVAYLAVPGRSQCSHLEWARASPLFGHSTLTRHMQSNSISSAFFCVFFSRAACGVGQPAGQRCRSRCLPSRGSARSESWLALAWLAGPVWRGIVFDSVRPINIGSAWRRRQRGSWQAQLDEAAETWRCAGPTASCCPLGACPALFARGIRRTKPSSS